MIQVRRGHQGHRALALLAIAIAAAGMGWLIHQKATSLHSHTTSEGEEARPSEPELSLEDQIRNLERVVEEKRQFLNMLVEGNVYSDPWHRAENEARTQVVNIRFERDDLARRIDCFNKTQGMEKLLFASLRDLDPDEFTRVHPNYIEAKYNLRALQVSGLGDRHPRILAQKKIIDDLNRKLRENKFTSLYEEYVHAKHGLISITASGRGDQDPQVIAQHQLIGVLSARCDRAILDLGALLNKQLLETNNRLKEATSLHQEKVDALAALPPDHFDFRWAADDFSQTRKKLQQLQEQTGHLDESQ